MFNLLAELKSRREVQKIKPEKTLKRFFGTPQLGNVEDFEEIPIEREILVEEFIRKICKTEAFICGGYARIACSPNNTPLPTNDIDIYLLELSNLDLLKKRIVSAGYIPYIENDVAFEFKSVLGINDYTINLIKPIQTGYLNTFGDLKHILNNFDFTVARVGIYLDSVDNKIKALADKDFNKDETDKLLNIKHIHCPIAEVGRIAKYINKGYKCPIRTIHRCFIDWDGRDDKFKQYLVDTLYSDEELTEKEVAELYSVLYID